MSLDAIDLDSEFSEHAPFLRNLARRLAGDRELAEDLVQETYVAARGGEPGRGHGLLPWLVGVLRNRARRAVRSAGRRRAREHAAFPAADSAPTVRLVDKLELARNLLHQVEALGEQGREVVFLRFYEGLMPQQIAARLDVPVATVKTRLARALARLRERLDADGGGSKDWLPAMCALGGLDAAVSTNPLPLVSAARRALAGWQLAAGLAVVIALAALTVRLWPEGSVAQPAVQAERTMPLAAQRMAAASERQRSFRSPAVSTAASTAAGQIVTGWVEDAGIGVRSGGGVPAANVVVRSRLRVREQPPVRVAVGGSTGQPTKLAAATNGEVTIEAITNAQGRFRIEVPVGAELLRVMAVGNGQVADAVWSIWTRSGLPQPLVLTRYLRSSFRGRVIDPSGASVAGAKVRLMHWHNGKRVGRECYTDALGGFQFASVPEDPWLQVECDGYVQVRASRPTRGPRGGWQPARVVMAKAATLEFTAESDGGLACGNCIEVVSAGLSEAESGLVAIIPDAAFPFRSRSKLVDGLATLTMPAGLQLALFAGNQLHLRQQAGRLLGPDAADGAPIVLAAGERKRLRLVVRTNVALQLTVLDPGGEPVPAGIDLSCTTVSAGQLVPLRAAETDAQGRFVLPVVSAERSVCIVVRARGAGATQGLAAVQMLLVEGMQPQPVEPQPVELHLGPPQDLTGSVRDQDGQPVEANVRRVLRIPGVAESITSSGYWSAGKDGSFRVPAIPGAQHRLEFACDSFATEVRSGLPMGGEAIEVVLHRPWPTQLELRVEDPDVRSLDVRIDYLQMAPGEAAALPLLAGTPRWSRADAPPGPGPSVVRTVNRFEQVVEGVVRLRLEQGTVRMAISGAGLRGARRTRCLTGPVRMPAGGIAVTVDVPKPVPCRGRILFPAGGPRFAACVALADDSGQLLSVSLPGAASWGTTLPATSEGHFAIGAVPPGSWELRVGTREELLRGEARWRQREVFVPDRDEPRIVRL